jgi:hypothetical protein
MGEDSNPPAYAIDCGRAMIILPLSAPDCALGCAGAPKLLLIHLCRNHDPGIAK